MNDTTDLEHGYNSIAELNSELRQIKRMIDDCQEHLRKLEALQLALELHKAELVDKKISRPT